MFFVILLSLLNISGGTESGTSTANMKESPGQTKTSGIQKLYESKYDGRKFYILVDLEIYDGISNSLDIYKNDLENDNYSPTILKVPRETSCEDIRRTLQDGYNNYNIEGAVMVGSLGIALCNVDPDPKYYPTDYYYMDLDGDQDHLSRA